MAPVGAIYRLLLFNFMVVKGYLSNSPHIITFWGQDPSLQDAEKVVRALNRSCGGKSTYSTVVIGFVNKSFRNKTTASLPPMHCVKSKKSRSKVSLYCPDVAKKLQQCQENKKKVLIGVGGPNETLYFDDAKSAQYFAKKIWNWFLGGNEISDMRPFGGMTLDGVNLFLKDAESKHVDTFLNTLNKLKTQQPDDKYTYTMSVPCNSPELYFGDGKNRLSKEKIIPLISQIYVRYSGKQCCQDGPKHFRSELHDWKQFAAKPKRPELFVLFPRNPHKAMTNCFSSNRQLSILHNVVDLKGKLANVITKIQSLYLTNERRRTGNSSDDNEAALSRDKIGSKDKMADDPLLPLQRLFANPNFNALYKEMSDLEKRINDKEDDLLFNDRHGIIRDSESEFPASRRMIKNSKAGKPPCSADKKSQIRLVLDIFTDKFHKASLSKVDLDKVAATVDGAVAKADTPQFLDKIGTIASGINDMEVAGGDDVMKKAPPQVLKYAINETTGKQSKEDQDLSNKTFPILNDSSENVGETKLPKKKHAKTGKSAGRSINLKGKEDLDDQQIYEAIHNSMIELDSDGIGSLDPADTVDTTNEKDSKQTSKDKILDHLFVSDDAESALSDIDLKDEQNNSNSSSSSTKSMDASPAEEGARNASGRMEIGQVSSDIKNNFETAGKFIQKNPLAQKGPPEIKLAIKLSDAGEADLTDSLLNPAEVKVTTNSRHSKPNDDSLEFVNANDELESSGDGDLVGSKINNNLVNRPSNNGLEQENVKTAFAKKHKTGSTVRGDSVEFMYPKHEVRTAKHATKQKVTDFGSLDEKKANLKKHQVLFDKMKEHDNIFSGYSVNKSLLEEAKKKFTENIYKTLSKFIPLDFDSKAGSSNPHGNKLDSFAKEPKESSEDPESVSYNCNQLKKGGNKRARIRCLQKKQNLIKTQNKKLPPATEDKQQLAEKAVSEINENVPLVVPSTEDMFQRKINELKRQLDGVKGKGKGLEGDEDNVNVVWGKAKVEGAEDKTTQRTEKGVESPRINTWNFDSQFARSYHDLKRKLKKVRFLKRVDNVSNTTIKAMVDSIDKEINDLTQRTATHKAQGLMKKQNSPHNSDVVGDIELGPVIDYFDYMDNEREDRKAKAELRKSKKQAAKRASPLKGVDSDSTKSDSTKSKNKNNQRKVKNKKTVRSHARSKHIRHHGKSYSGSNLPIANLSLSPNGTFSISGASIASTPIKLNSNTLTPHSKSASAGRTGTAPGATPYVHPFPYNLPHYFKGNLAGSTPQVAYANAASSPSNTQSNNPPPPAPAPPAPAANYDSSIKNEAMNHLNSELDPHITNEAMNYLNTDGAIDNHPPFDQRVSIRPANAEVEPDDPYYYSNHDAVIDFNYLHDTNYSKQPYAFTNSHATISFNPPPKGKRSSERDVPSSADTSSNVRNKRETSSDEKGKRDSAPQLVKVNDVLAQFSQMFPPVLYPFADLDTLNSKQETGTPAPDR